MSVDAILIVENSRQISLEQFQREIKTDDWSKSSELLDYFSWIEFKWDGIAYFSLASGAPCFKFLMPESCDSKSQIAYDNPDFDPDAQTSFLKIALAAEKIAGGPVYFGNDVVNQREPSEDIEENDFFSIPLEIDSLIPEWRQIALQT